MKSYLPYIIGALLLLTGAGLKAWLKHQHKQDQQNQQEQRMESLKDALKHLEH